MPRIKFTSASLTPTVNVARDATPHFPTHHPACCLRPSQSRLQLLHRQQRLPLSCLSPSIFPLSWASGTRACVSLISRSFHRYDRHFGSCGPIHDAALLSRQRLLILPLLLLLSLSSFCSFPAASASFSIRKRVRLRDSEKERRSLGSQQARRQTGKRRRERARYM